MPFNPFGHGAGARPLDTTHNLMFERMYYSTDEVAWWRGVYDPVSRKWFNAPGEDTGVYDLQSRLRSVQVDNLVDMLRAWIRRALDP